MTDEESMVLTITIIAIVLIIAIRELVLWYYKINKRTELLEDIKAYTMFIARNQYPEKFDVFHEKYESAKRPSRKRKPQLPKP